MRIGIFGGTFNPPHIGHLILAQSALDALQLDRILFIPAHQSPFKPGIIQTAAEDRMEMLSLAISDHPKFEVSPIEFERQGVSYTVDTLVSLRSRFPDATFTLLMGADAFLEFPQWKEPDTIVQYCRIGVAQRPGHALDAQTHAYGRWADVFFMPEIGISSSGIREAVRLGLSIRYYVPWAVNVYIEAKGLYR